MSDPNSHMHLESVIFLERAKRSRSANYISEEEYFLQTEKPYVPGIRDAVMLTLGDWMIKLGTQIKKRNAYARLSEKQA